MQEELFEFELPKDDSPKDPTDINSLHIMFSDEELAEFKARCKRILKRNPHINNPSDLLLNILRIADPTPNTNGTDNIKKIID